jgi:translation elongation factor EF-1beta
MKELVVKFVPQSEGSTTNTVKQKDVVPITTESMKAFLNAVAKTQSFKYCPLGFYKIDECVVSVRGEDKLIKTMKKILSGIKFTDKGILFVGFNKEEDVMKILLAMAQHISQREHPICFGLDFLQTESNILVKLADNSQVGRDDIERYVNSVHLVEEQFSQAVTISTQEEVFAV